MKQAVEGGRAENRPGPGGLAGWLLGRLRAARGHGARPHLAVVERIALGPRHSLALVEAEGRRLLVATSTDGTPAFYALDRPGRRANTEGGPAGGARRTPAAARVSW